MPASPQKQLETQAQRSGVPPVRVAAVQATPIFMNREATIEKACRLIAEAAAAGAQLAVFPEAFIPGYPDWVWSVPAGESDLMNHLYARLMENSVAIPGPATQALCQAAREAGIMVVMGLNEINVEAGGGSLYNSLLYIDAHGSILGKHRKLVPTGGERLVWAQGDGSTLAVYDTPLGRLGGLICWENYMPLARYCLYAWGVQMYAAPTWDNGEPWLSTLRHIGKESRAMVIGCCMPLRVDDLPADLGLRERYPTPDGWINPGDSAIVSPQGKILAGPLHEKEGILYADVDPAGLSGAKWVLDVAGHYARPDVFSLTVHTAPHPLVRTAPKDE
jgi:nitrilase